MLYNLKIKISYNLEVKKPYNLKIKKPYNLKIKKFYNLKAKIPLFLKEIKFFFINFKYNKKKKRLI